MSKRSLSHLDDEGRARMVDVGGKQPTDRWAAARGNVLMSRSTFEAAEAGDLKKGDLRAAAELAGIMAAKRTFELIPLCHPLPLSSVEVSVDFETELPGITITSIVRTHARTGAEMEALTAVSVAALTVYDMVKGMDKAARITDIRLLEKHGGKSGDVTLEEWRG
jgi:cyclic pyranopterin phosphate synthase